MPPAKFEHMAIDDVTHLSPPPTFGFNGFSDIDMMDVPLEELEKEMPLVTEEQVPLGGLLSRVVQAIYAELSELAETYGELFHLLTTMLISTACRTCLTRRGNGRLRIGL